MKMVASKKQFSYVSISKWHALVVQLLGNYTVKTSVILEGLCAVFPKVYLSTVIILIGTIRPCNFKTMVSLGGIYK